MMLEEAQARLKKERITTQDQLWQINSLYILFDLHKDDFCKIIDAVGLEKLTGKQAWYDRLLRASDELDARERYQAAQKRLEEITAEQEQLGELIRVYREKHTA